MRAGFRAPRTGDEPRTGGRLAGKALQGRTYLTVDQVAMWPEGWVWEQWGTGSWSLVSYTEELDFILNNSGKSIQRSAGLRPDLILFFKGTLSVEKEIRWGRHGGLWARVAASRVRCVPFTFQQPYWKWMVCIYIFWSISLWPFKKTYFSLGFKFQLFTYTFVSCTLVSLPEIYFVEWGLRERKKKERREYLWTDAPFLKIHLDVCDLAVKNLSAKRNLQEMQL